MLRVVDNSLYSGEYIQQLPDYQQHYLIALRELTKAWLQDDTHVWEAKLHLQTKYSTNSTVLWLRERACEEERWQLDIGSLEQLYRLTNLRELSQHQAQWLLGQQKIQDCKTKKGLRNWSYLDKQVNLVILLEKELFLQFENIMKKAEARRVASVLITETPVLNATASIDWDKEIILESD